MVKIAVQVALGLALLVIGWVLTSSLLFLWLDGLLGDPRLAWWQRPIAWVLYARVAGRDWIELMYLAVSVLPLPTLVVCFAVRSRKTGRSSLYGKTIWASDRDVKRAGFRHE